MGVRAQVVKADEPHVERRARKRLNYARIAVVLLLIQRVVHHMAAPGAHFAPAVQNGHCLDTIGRGALDVVVQLAELVAHALHIVDEFRERAGQLQITAVADAVDGLAQDGAARRHPVFLRLAHRVAALMEGVREEIGQKASLGIFHARNVADEAQRGAVAHAAHHGVKADGLELVHKGLGADPVVAQEHHGLFAQLVGDVHHLFGQLCHLAPLEGLEILEFPGGHAVLVVVVALVDDEFGPELIAGLPLELFEDIRGHAGGITVPVHIFLPLQLVEHQCELVEERGVADDVHIWVLGNEFAQALHGELMRFGLTHVEGDLVLEVFPAVGDGVVHVHRVPDQIGEKTYRIFMKSFYSMYYYVSALFVIAPVLRWHHTAGSTVHDLPPALDVVAGVHLH